MASAGNFIAWALSMSRSKRQAPSSREYSVCRCKWTKSACAMVGVYRWSRARSKEEMFTSGESSKFQPSSSKERGEGPLQWERAQAKFVLQLIESSYCFGVKTYGTDAEAVV